MNKIRVLYLVKQFPQISETYIRSEIEAVSDECDVRVITFLEADAPYASHAAYEQNYDLPWPDQYISVKSFTPR